MLKQIMASARGGNGLRGGQVMAGVGKEVACIFKQPI
jgi:hypothetical protein